MNGIPVKIIKKDTRKERPLASCPILILGATGKKGEKNAREIFSINMITKEKKIIWKKKK